MLLFRPLTGESARRAGEGHHSRLQNSFPTSPDIVPFSFYLGRDGSGKERSVSRTSRNCQSHVQRLRVSDEVTATPGSRGCVPGELCHLLPLCCSNPRRGSVSLPYWWEAASLPVRLCECMPWAEARMKSAGNYLRSEMPAQIAALQGWASSRIHYIFHTTACWLEARTGASSPSIFTHAMPP